MSSATCRRSRRPEASQKHFPVSWDEFHRDARALTWRLAAAGPFEAIVCVTRGGLVPAAIVARELGDPPDRDGVRRELPRLPDPGRSAWSRASGRHRSKIGGGDGKGVLIVDDLVDTGKTAKIVRDLLPKAHFATVYAKPMGRPMVDTFITEVSQDTWIYLSLGHRARVPAADPARGGVAARHFGLILEEHARSARVRLEG